MRTNVAGGSPATGGNDVQMEFRANNLPIHDLLRAQEFNEAVKLIERSSPADLSRVDAAGNSALHLACLATRGIIPPPIETVEVTFPNGCSSGTTVKIQSSGREPTLVTVSDEVAPGGQFMAVVEPSAGNTQIAPSAADSAAAVRVIEALLKQDDGQLLRLKTKDGFWAGQLCRPGEPQEKLLHALHQALIKAARECDISLLNSLKYGIVFASLKLS